MSSGERRRVPRGRREYAGPRDTLGRPLPAGYPDCLPDRMDPEQVGGKSDKAFEIGVRLFDEQRFWEAHEFFEYVWKCDDVGRGDRDFWRGVTQVAVGFCHAQRGNAPGAVTLLNRATGNLDGYPSPHLRVHTRRLRGLATRVCDEIQARGNAHVRGFPRFPIVVPSS